MGNVDTTVENTVQQTSGNIPVYSSTVVVLRVEYGTCTTPPYGTKNSPRCSR